MAKRLLAQKGAAFEEIDVTGDWAARDELTEKAGGRTTVPQIWIGERARRRLRRALRARPRRRARRAARWRRCPLPAFQAAKRPVNPAA